MQRALLLLLLLLMQHLGENFLLLHHFVGLFDQRLTKIHLSVQGQFLKLGGTSLMQDGSHMNVQRGPLRISDFANVAFIRLFVRLRRRRVAVMKPDGRRRHRRSAGRRRGGGGGGGSGGESGRDAGRGAGTNGAAARFRAALQLVKVGNGVVMNQKDVLLREAFLAHFAFEGAIRIQIFFHGIAQLVALAMQKSLVVRG